MKKHKRYQDLLSAIEAERSAEEAYYRSLTIKKKIKDRVESGITWYPVQINKKHYTVGELVEIEVERVKGAGLPHKIRTGAGCDLFVNDEGSTRFKGVVSYMKRDKMGIIFSASVFDKEQIPDQGNIGVELVYDERPYQVMRSTMQAVIASQDLSIVALRDGLTAPLTLQEAHLSAARRYSLPDYINPSQQQAVRQAIAARHVAVIHGPPGTGKTTTVCALVQTLLQHERQILVCAPSNNAVDLLAKKMDAVGLRVLRIGNVSRIGDSIAHLSLDEQASNHKEWSHIKKIKIEAEEARRQAGSFKRKYGKAEARNRHEMYQEARDLRKWAREMESRLTAQIIDDAQVIATTLIGVSHRLLDGVGVETVIIDEASQAMEPECWTAILKAKRVVLVGDHYQLPPTVKSNEAHGMGLSTTMLDLLADKIKYTHRLGVQYRMNDSILHFPNKQFYASKLLSHESNRRAVIQGDDQPLLWIDTSGCSFDEKQHPENNSRWNEGEYFIMREHILKHIDMYQGASIGVIAPYAQQVRYIRLEMDQDPQLQALDIEVNSIDGFQGQEKDIIYLSLVRSNDSGQIGFLSDARRLNVALTRARKKLVIVADTGTVCTDPTYDSLVDHIMAKATYQSAWEYMS